MGISDSPIIQQSETIAAEESGAAVGSIPALQGMGSCVPCHGKALLEGIENIRLHLLQTEDVRPQFLRTTCQCRLPPGRVENMPGRLRVPYRPDVGCRK